MKKVILALIIAFLMLLFGCQATPETSIVTAKNIDQMLIKASEDKRNEVLPKAYNNTFSTDNNKLIVSIDAEVSNLGNERYPVIQVTACNFSQELANRIIAAFFKEETLYKATNVRSKQVIEKEILDLKCRESEFADKDDIVSYNAMIEALQEEYLAAPDSSSSEIFDGRMYEITEAITPNSSLKYEGLCIGTTSVFLGEGKYLTISNNPLNNEQITEKNGNTTFRYPATVCAVLNYIDNTSDFANKQYEEVRCISTAPSGENSVRELSLTPQNVQQQALKLLSSLEIDADVFDIWLVKNSSETSKSDDYAYEIRCTRKYDDAQCVRFGQALGIPDED